MRNYQIYPYFLHYCVVLRDTGVGTVPNKQNFASTAKRWMVVRCRGADHHQTSKLAFYIALVLASGEPKD